MKYRIGFMDMALYKRLINEISSYSDRTIVLFRRGEALLHPAFLQMLLFVKDRFKEIQLATNASLMDKKTAHIIADCVTSISFSLELPERYNKYKSLDYATVVRNVIYFLSINRKTKTQVSIVKTEDICEKHIERFKIQWLDKVDRVRIYEEHSKNGRFGDLGYSRGKRKPCVKPFNDILIFWDGKVGRCNHDWGEKPLGSVANKTIAEIWRSQSYTHLRKQHLNLTITDNVCQKCNSWYEEIGLCKIGRLYERNKKE
jgi:radical SAM protein with 4Fe4S-binding SPASM domain